ncbi:MAG: hypothetical protein KF784_07900 [Fimbriimonadaceae bacterium]|nr:hypothetical protein [Fimbriimonadaceae bacterium]
MKKCLFIVIVAALAGSIVAQVTKPVGISVRIGTFSPSTNVAKDQGESWFFGGFDWKLRDLSFDANSGSSTSLALSVDAYQKGKMGAIPILLNWVHRNDEWYWSVGAGIALNKDFRESGSDTITVRDERFAYQATLGYDFMKRKSPLFAEVKYFGNSRDRLNGFAFAVGIRL